MNGNFTDSIQSGLKLYAFADMSSNFCDSLKFSSFDAVFYFQVAIAIITVFFEGIV